MPAPTQCIAVILGLGLTALNFTSVDAQRARYDRDTYSEKHKAGDFDYYTLVLSWSPTHCGSPQGRNDHTQCNPRRARGYAFILHGLWPQYERGYPERCRTPFRPFVSKRTIASMMDIMPSKRLIIHEYRKHGTCSGMGPKDYFDLSRKLFDTITIPAAFQGPAKEQFFAPDAVKKQFAAENPGLTPEMMSVVCRGAGKRLREVRFCFTKAGRLRQCSTNENQRRLCSAKRMFVPPVRYRRR